MECGEEFLKVEVEDEMGIFVKEEESFMRDAGTSACDEDVSIDLADLLVEPRPQYVEIEASQKELLVYTKKLDDMKVWKCLSKYKYQYPKCILDTIITESKTALPKTYKKKKTRKSLVKFKKFISNLQIYKEMVAEKSNNYVQQRFKAEVTDENQKQQSIQGINVYDDDCNAIAIDTNIVPISPTTAVDHQTSTKHVISARYIVTIHTLGSLSDVYVVNNSGFPTEFYRTDEDIASSSHMTTNLYFNSCCWFKRDTVIKHMNLENCSPNVFTFMRRPHGCDKGNCTCCCRRKYKYVSQFATPKTIQRTAKSHLKNRWHQRLLSHRALQNPNSLINAALVHKPKIKSHNEKEKNLEYYRNLCLKLKCNNMLPHVYYLGKNGLISTYIRPNTFCTLQYLNDMIGSCLSSVPSENICCMTEYKKYCLTLIKLAHPTVVKFLINSSFIKPNKCVTCENQAIQHAVDSKRAMIPLYLPKYPRHTKPYSKVTIRAFNVLEKERNMQPNTISNTVIDSTNCKSKKSSLPNASQNISEENNTQTCIASRINKNIAPNLINLSIKDLRLTIFPGGKVKILTKTNVGKISTETLTILRGIIRHAQNKVSSQKFSPTRLIHVKNVFTNHKPESKKTSTNILWNVLNSTEKQQNHRLNESNNIHGNKVKPKIINSQPVTKRKVAIQPELNLIKQDNVYQVLTNISAEKRKQYLISHEFLRNAENNLWATDNALGHQEVDEDVIHNMVITKDNAKRKTSEKGTSPPPKQLRKETLGNRISVVPMASSNTNFLPIIPPNVSTESIRQPQTTTLLSTLPKAPMQQVVPTESLQVPNASFSLPENVSVIAIGKLPQELVTSLYKKYASNSENNQLSSLLAQPLRPINVTEHLFPTTSLLDNTTPFVSLHNSNVTSVPVVQNTQADNDDADGEEDDCILGV